MRVPDPALVDALAAGGRAALAWEVLRRDPGYRATFAAMRSGSASDLAADPLFTARWGLHFR
jgi:hypothetical protein